MYSVAFVDKWQLALSRCQQLDRDANIVQDVSRYSELKSVLHTVVYVEALALKLQAILGPGFTATWQAIKGLEAPIDTQLHTLQTALQSDPRGPRALLKSATGGMEPWTTLTKTWTLYKQRLRAVHQWLNPDLYHNRSGVVRFRRYLDTQVFWDTLETNVLWTRSLSRHLYRDQFVALLHHRNTEKRQFQRKMYTQQQQAIHGNDGQAQQQQLALTSLSSHVLDRCTRLVESVLVTAWVHEQFHTVHSWIRRSMPQETKTKILNDLLPVVKYISSTQYLRQQQFVNQMTDDDATVADQIDLQVDILTQDVQLVFVLAMFRHIHIVLSSTIRQKIMQSHETKLANRRVSQLLSQAVTAAVDVPSVWYPDAVGPLAVPDTIREFCDRYGVDHDNGGGGGDNSAELVARCGHPRIIAKVIENWTITYLRRLAAATKLDAAVASGDSLIEMSSRVLAWLNGEAAVELGAVLELADQTTRNSDAFRMINNVSTQFTRYSNHIETQLETTGRRLTLDLDQLNVAAIPLSAEIKSCVELESTRPYNDFLQQFIDPSSVTSVLPAPEAQSNVLLRDIVGFCLASGAKQATERLNLMFR